MIINKDIECYELDREDNQLVGLRGACLYIIINRIDNEMWRDIGQQINDIKDKCRIKQ